MSKRNNNKHSDKIHNLDSLFTDMPLNSFDNSSENDLSVSKINKDNMNENLDTDYKLSSNETNSNKNIIDFHNYKIEKINLYIEGQKPLSDKMHNNKLLKKRGRISNKSDINNNKKKKIHDKFYDDNLTKKCKNIILKYALKFINEKIEEKYLDDIGYGKFKKELKIINQKNKVKSTVNVDRTFLDKNLKDIFSENISARFNNFPETYNKTLIESLINEEDKEKKIYFTELFNITFFECLQYFIDDNNNNEKLEGFIRFSAIKKSLLKKHEKEYIDALEYFLKNFKDILNNKRARKNSNDD